MSEIQDAIKASQTSITATAQSYLPEPSSSGMGVFRDILSVVSSVGSAVLGARSGLLGIANGADLNGVSGTNNELILAQIEMQREMQVTSMISNIEKSKHEAQMTPIRNIRVS
ncbi:MAG: hypothetical protein LBE20_03280 [Deltaproteobacteria bacterium]|jgi:hypothetical protein|nr:hypothetical protein [Deltaproteobacteria bacterium]